VKFSWLSALTLFASGMLVGEIFEDAGTHGQRCCSVSFLSNLTKSPEIPFLRETKTASPNFIYESGSNET
jgi:hypothetical protein